MSSELTCSQCNCPYVYPMGALMICPECAYEWNPEFDSTVEEEGSVVIDANGNRLANGDTVSVIKSLPVKGAPKPIKIGTKVSNITLVDGDHNISCKVSGFGSMMLKSEFVKKVNLT
jgi:protein PhnA